MDFEIPADIAAYLRELDDFIEREIQPLERENDNIRFFDHRREYARTDFDNDGEPRQEWEELLGEMRAAPTRPAICASACPRSCGGQDGSNLEMAIIREHLAHKGLGLHNDLQNESSIVGNFPTVLMMHDFGTEEQKDRVHRGHAQRHRAPRLRPDRAQPRLRRHLPGDHGGQRRRRVGDQRHEALQHRPAPRDPRHRLRPHLGQAGRRARHHAPSSCRPTRRASRSSFIWWTFNMPTDHAEVTLTNVRVPASTDVRARTATGSTLAQHFVHENRIRQAASSLGAAQYCIDEAVAYAKDRITWGKPLATNQAIQFPLVELHTEAAMLRQLVRKTAWQLDRQHHMEVTDMVAMCNYRANRLACEAADRAMQILAASATARHMPFEHIYRHHRRYRITEGSEEIQMRRVAGALFGFWGAQKASTAPE